MTLDRKGELNRDDAQHILNPHDEGVVEAGLQLREAYGGEVAALTVGQLLSEGVLREALAMGVDVGYLLYSPVSVDLNSSYAAHIASHMLRHLLETFDVILCSGRSVDWEGEEFGPIVAGKLGLPIITDVSRISFEDGKFEVVEELQDHYRTVEVSPPVLLTVAPDRFRPRYIRMSDIYEAYHSKRIELTDVQKLGVDLHQISLVQLKELKSVEEKDHCERISGSISEVAEQLARLLKRLGRS